MQTYRFSELTEETLSTLVSLNRIAGVSEAWTNMQEVALTPAELGQLDYLKSIWRERHLVALNEATVWARAIYPMLVLAERDYVQAWSGVPMKATYPTFQLEGEADGALAPEIGGKIQQPYLIVHEAKRGVNTSPDPEVQLLGEMLAAAWLNWKKDANPEQEIFGCYTVAATWSFVQGIVSDIDSEKPAVAISFAPEYNGVSDAERILKILKGIVAKQHSKYN